jgi:hypothetical protein
VTESDERRATEVLGVSGGRPSSGFKPNRKVQVEGQRQVRGAWSVERGARSRGDMMKCTQRQQLTNDEGAESGQTRRGRHVGCVKRRHAGLCSALKSSGIQGTGDES